MARFAILKKVLEKGTLFISEAGQVGIGAALIGAAGLQANRLEQEELQAKVKARLKDEEEL